MLELKNIYKSYQLKNKKIEVLKDINLKFNSKGMTFILGKSGSGKTTLLNIIGGLDKYDSGYLIIDSKSTETFKNKDYDFYRNNYIGFIFQDNNLIEDYTVYENICLAVNLQSKKVNDKEIDELLNNLEISDLKSRKISELSGGQKGRVAIARALIKKPKIILADEPTGNLDTSTSREVMNLLKKISGDYLVIVVTHDIKCANIYGDRILEIKDGIITNDSNKVLEIDNNIYEIKKSKLPLKDAFKLGFISLKNKKLSLLFTTLLMSILMIFLTSLFAILTYDIEKSNFNLIKNTNITDFQIRKFNYYYNIYERKNYSTFKTLESNDINVIKDKLHSDGYVASYLFPFDNSATINNVLKFNIEYSDGAFSTPNVDMYTKLFNYFIVECEENKNPIKEKIIGSFPKNNNEVVISNYLANIIIKYGMFEYNSGHVFKPNSYEEIIKYNQFLNFGSNDKIKIVGIINYDLKKYDKLNGVMFDRNNTPFELNRLESELDNDIRFKYSYIYTKKGFLDNLYKPTATRLDRNYTFELKLNNKLQDLASFNYIKDEATIFDGKEWVKKSDLKDNEIIISFNNVLENEGISFFDDYLPNLNKYIAKYPYKTKEELQKEFASTFIDFSKYIHQEVSVNIYGSSDYNEKKEEYKNLKIVGIDLLDDVDGFKNLLSKNILEKYNQPHIVNQHILVKEDNLDKIKDLVYSFPSNSNYVLFSGKLDAEMMGNGLNDFKNIFIIGSIILLVFSLILTFNFMYTSINKRKKDIGILKAMGAKNFDIIKIFMVEIMLLTVFITIVSSLFVLIFFTYLNKTMYSSTSIYALPTILTPLLVLLICIYSFLIISMSSFFPLLKIFKMKPVDAINRR